MSKCVSNCCYASSINCNMHNAVQKKKSVSNWLPLMEVQGRMKVTTIIRVTNKRCLVCGLNVKNCQHFHVWFFFVIYDQRLLSHRAVVWLYCTHNGFQMWLWNLVMLSAQHIRLQRRLTYNRSSCCQIIWRSEKNDIWTRAVFRTDWF